MSHVANQTGVLGGKVAHVAHQARNVKDVQCALKRCVERAGINEMGKSQLVDPTKPLECGRGDIRFLTLEPDEAVNRISDAC